MRRVALTIGVIALALVLAACAGNNTQPTTTTASQTRTTDKRAVATTTASNTDCLPVPAAFFTDIETRGQVVKSAAVKSAQQTTGVSQFWAGSSVVID